MNPINVNVEKIVIPTYENAPYEEYPMFAFNRIHQGTTGNPFPYRVINKVRRDSKIEKTYTAVHLENEYLDIIILPELGGRIFTAKDKTNGCDFFYRHHVIKPALIGIYGLWISGGVEFNWPRHHRPSTFMPTDFLVEHTQDGGVVVWMSEHDPLFRMKGMVGVALYPGRAILETRMKIFNRTALPHAFHWWENAALSVNENFQVFFPPDVTYVNYHYRKATGAYPVMDEYFYVQDNRGGRDIRFHKNSEQATSYFSGISKHDFFGGYDHGNRRGVIHYASHYTSPGKKMFTWGYRNRAKAWETALTDSDGPYVELMASSYSDNQPDFTWIEPYETKEFNQVWYPYKEIGEPVAANERAALGWKMNGSDIVVDIYATENFPEATLELHIPGTVPVNRPLNLEACSFKKIHFPMPGGTMKDGLSISLKYKSGVIILAYTKEISDPYVPEPIQSVPAPDLLSNAGDCYTAGVHIDQYYDPAIEPSIYWEKGLEIDPDHPGCLTNLGRFHIARLNHDEAEGFLRKAVKSLTRYNPNPRDSEAFYLLGLVFIEKKSWAEALEMLHKACWSACQIIPASCAIAMIYIHQGEYEKAESWLFDLIRRYGRNQKAVQLLITSLRMMGKREASLAEARILLADDPLDLYALNELRLLGEEEPANKRFVYRREETGLDLVADYSDLGLYKDALDLIRWIEAREGLVSLMFYAKGFIQSLMGNAEEAKDCYNRAKNASQGMRFGSSSFEKNALTDAVKLYPEDPRASLELGILIYGINRKAGEAIVCWRRVLRSDSHSIQAMRNLAVGLFNINNKDPEVFALLEEAVRQKPDDIQLIYERNLVMELQNISLERRKEVWENMNIDPESWDELYLQGIRLYNQLGMRDKALSMILNHAFIPAEGGEAVMGLEYGGILETMGYSALATGNAEAALDYFRRAGDSPLNIGGGALHQVCLCPCKYGEALSLSRLGRKKEALEALEWIASFPVNYFTRSMLPTFLCYRGMALLGLDRKEEGKVCLEETLKDAEIELNRTEYGLFSTTSAYNSFIKNPSEQRRFYYSLLMALALNGLKRKQKALALLEDALDLEPFSVQARLVKMVIEA